MKVHEHQARDILSAAGVPVPEGAVARTVEEAVSAAQAVFAAGGQLVVIKAQVHAGGWTDIGEDLFLIHCRGVVSDYLSIISLRS